MNAIHLTDREDGVLLTAKEEGQCVSLGPDRLSQARELQIYAVWSKDAAGGNIIIETAHHQGYVGAWQEVGEIPWVSSDAVRSVSIRGVHLALRLRLLDDVVGGTVTLYGIAN